jgi:hypothetical protein
MPSPPPVQRTAVVHLVRHANGVAAFAAFMAAFERIEAGLEHDLVLLCKGFADARALAPILERAAAHRPALVQLSDEGFDLGAYAAAARVLEHERLCFLNSFSTPLVDGWLGRLDAALADGRAGAAGATGSWASNLEFGLYLVGLPTAYSDVLPGRAAARAAMHELNGSVPASALRDWAYNAVMTARYAPGTARFPAIHLRTNAFLVDRALFASLRIGRAATKWATYQLESGRRSLTRQLVARGRPPVVVDRTGAAREPGDWPDADVFWQAGQADLLVADNQTRSYDAAPAHLRAILSAQAWGLRARPA